MFLFGGHTLVVDPADKSESDVVHDDVWALDLNTHQVLADVSQHVTAVRADPAAEPLARVHAGAAQRAPPGAALFSSAVHSACTPACDPACASRHAPNAARALPAP